jgi:hypothetical protein
MSASHENELWDRLKEIEKHLAEQKKALEEVQLDRAKLAEWLGPESQPGSQEERKDPDLKDLDQRAGELQKDIARLEQERQNTERAAIERDQFNAQRLVDDVSRQMESRDAGSPPAGGTVDTRTERAQDQNLVEKTAAVNDRKEETVRELAEAQPKVEPPPHSFDAGLAVALAVGGVLVQAKEFVDKLTEPDALGKRQQEELAELKRDHKREQDELRQEHEAQQEKFDARHERMKTPEADREDKQNKLDRNQASDRVGLGHEQEKELQQLRETHEKERRAQDRQKEVDVERERDRRIKDDPTHQR